MTEPVGIVLVSHSPSLAAGLAELLEQLGGGVPVFAAGGTDTMAFHGRYLAVTPDERIVWTNDEEDEGAVTTVTFEDQGGKTLLTFHELYPSKEALDEAMAGSAAGLPAQLYQLEELLPTIGA